MSNTAATEDISALRRDIDQLRSDLKHLRTDLSGLTGDLLNAAKTGAAQTREKLEEKAKVAAAKGREAAETVEEQVSTHPFISLGTALAVGLALGFGLSRRD